MARDGRDVISVYCMKNVAGNVVSDSDGMKNICRKYMEKLLNVENDWDGEVDYDWAHVNNMFLMPIKFNYASFNGPMTPCGSNVYTNPNMEIISSSINVLDLGIYMSGDRTFNYHISSLSKKCANLSGWILRTFYTRDCITMLTLFKSTVLSRLDYGSQLWSPFLIKHITQLEKIQRSFTKHITAMNEMPYHERLKSLGLYSLQRRRERYCIIYIWKIIEGFFGS